MPRPRQPLPAATPSAANHFSDRTLTYDLAVGHDGFSAADSEGSQVTIDGAWYGAGGAEAAGVLHDHTQQLVGAFATTRE